MLRGHDERADKDRTPGGPPDPLAAELQRKYLRDHAEEFRKYRAFRFLRDKYGMQRAYAYARKEKIEMNFLTDPRRWTYGPIHGWIEGWMWDGWYANESVWTTKDERLIDPSRRRKLTGERVVCQWRPWHVRAFRNLVRNLRESPRCPKPPFTIYWLDAERLLSADRKRRISVEGCQHEDHTAADHGDPR